jgi:hypothetical protein
VNSAQHTNAYKMGAKGWKRHTEAWQASRRQHVIDDNGSARSASQRQARERISPQNAFSLEFRIRAHRSTLSAQRTKQVPNSLFRAEWLSWHKPVPRGTGRLKSLARDFGTSEALRFH